VYNALWRAWINTAIGLVVILVAVACCGLLTTWAVRRTGLRGGYELTADFASVENLRPLDAVEIARVTVGNVESISLIHDAAHVVLHMKASVRVPADSQAAIKTKGLIGESYVAIEPGHSQSHLAPGGRIPRTLSATSLEDSIGATVFGKVP